MKFICFETGVLLLALASACSDTSAAPSESSSSETSAPENEAESGEAAETSAPAPEPDEPAPEPEPPQIPTSLVDLLHVGGARVAASSVYEGNLSQVARLVDGDVETAWNGETGELQPVLAIELPEGRVGSAIELIPGYAKAGRNLDLFTANLRVREIEVVQASGETSRHTLDIESRELQRIEFPEGLSSSFLIRVVSTEPGSRRDFREVCISELRVMGTGEAGTASPQTSLYEVVSGVETVNAAQAAGEELLGLLGDEQPSDLEDETASAIRTRIATTEGLHITAITLSPDMDGRTPLDPRGIYSKSGDERVYCTFRLENPDEEATEVTLGWENDAGESRSEPRAIPVPSRRRFGHNRYTSLHWRRTGEYHCVIRNAEGDELARASFDLGE